MPSIRKSFPVHGRIVTGSLVALAALLLGAGVGHGGEFVPSIGLTKSLNGGSDAQVYGGLAIRGNLAPILEGEVAAAYRSESRFNDQLRLRMWPVTASLYLKPVPALYAGGGVGWYHTTYDYESDLIGDETVQKFGVHVGGGLKVPVAPRVALDLGGRYVKLQDQESKLIPEKFDPSFWTLSMGLALKF